MHSAAPLAFVYICSVDMGELSPNQQHGLYSPSFLPSPLEVCMLCEGMEVHCLISEFCHTSIVTPAPIDPNLTSGINETRITIQGMNNGALWKRITQENHVRRQDYC